MLNRYNCVDALCRAGISHTDAIALRRISMTLHRWHELECGDSNDYYYFCLVRGKRTSTREKTEQGLNVRVDTFEHDDAGKPFIERHENRSTRGDGKYRAYWSPIPDRERGALKRLAAIMAHYPAFLSYVPGAPRGCALYILRPGDVREGASIDSCYSNGIAVCK